MIFGSIHNLEQDRTVLPKALVRGLEFLKSADLATIPPGKHEIEGNALFALVQDNRTAPKTECKAETHRKYIDIQYVQSGSEIIGYSTFDPENPILEDRLDQNDVVFYKQVKDEIDLVLTPGRYVIFFPTDVHRPGCMRGSPGLVRKIVMKIAVDRL